MEKLCTELRTGGFSEAEGVRLTSLLFNVEEKRSDNGLNTVLEAVKNLGK